MRKCEKRKLIKKNKPIKQWKIPREVRFKSAKEYDEYAATLKPMTFWDNIFCNYNYK